MHLSDHLPEGAILVLPKVVARTELFPLLVDALCPAHGLSDRDGILAAIFEREAKMSTAVGRRIAIPHARLESSPGLCAAAAVCPAGVDFPTPDMLAVNLVFLLVSPPDAAGLHVKALAAVGRLGQDLVDDLLGSPDAAGFLRRLAVGEGRPGT